MHENNHRLLSWKRHFKCVWYDIVSTDLYSLGAMATLHKDLMKGLLNMMNHLHWWSVNKKSSSPEKRWLQSLLLDSVYFKIVLAIVLENLSLYRKAIQKSWSVCFLWRHCFITFDLKRHLYLFAVGQPWARLEQPHPYPGPGNMHMEPANHHGKHKHYQFHLTQLNCTQTHTSSLPNSKQ